MKKEDHHPLSPSLMDHPAVLWISDNFRMLIQGLILAVAVLFVVYRVSSSNSTQAQTDYIKAANNFSIIANTKSTASALAQQEALDDLRDILSKHPDLNAKYDGWLAQALLNQNKVTEATPFGESAIKRTANNNLPLYNAFANTSLLISNGNYSQALTDSQALKEQLLAENKENADSLLLAFTQLRISLLNQLTDNPSAERSAWTDFKQYTTTGNYTSSFQSLSNNFVIGTLPLSVYIDARIKALQQ